MLETKNIFTIEAIMDDDFNNFTVVTPGGQEVLIKAPEEHVKMEECSKDLIERIKERVKRI